MMLDHRQGCTRRFALRGLGSLVCCSAIAAGVRPVAASCPPLPLSTESTSGHTLTRIIGQFAEEIGARSDHSLEVEVTPNAQMFRDREVPAALHRGRLALGIVGIWHLSAHVSDFGILMGPAVYGLPQDPLRALVNGTTGAALTQSLEQTLDIHVLGEWLDLGHAHIFTMDTPVQHPDDLRDLVIRTPGGQVNTWRMRQFGADPVSVAWPDVPSVLQDQLVDGVLTTAHSATSATLWEHRVRYAYLDREFCSFYVPLISRPIWQRLSETDRTLMTEVWAETVEASRSELVRSQDRALDQLCDNGVSTYVPSDEILDETRRRLMADSGSLYRQAGIDAQLAADAESAA